jgi:hypothetical protein
VIETVRPKPRPSVTAAIAETEHRRVVDRDLGGVPDRASRLPPVDVVDAEHVGDEEAVERPRSSSWARSVQ